MRPLNPMAYDLDGVRRVARALLRHVRPRSRSEAYALLDDRLGVYVIDRAMLRAEVDYFFDDARLLAA